MKRAKESTTARLRKELQAVTFERDKFRLVTALMVLRHYGGLASLDATAFEELEGTNLGYEFSLSGATFQVTGKLIVAPTSLIVRPH